MGYIKHCFRSIYPLCIIAARLLPVCPCQVVKHGGDFVLLPVVPYAHHFRKLSGVMECFQVFYYLRFEVHYITFATNQLSTSCGTDSGAEDNCKNLLAGFLFTHVSGTYFPSTVRNSFVFSSIKVIAP